MTMHQMITRSLSLLSMLLLVALPHANSQVVVQDTNLTSEGSSTGGTSSQVLMVFQTVSNSQAFGDFTGVFFDAQLAPSLPVIPPPPPFVELAGTNVAVDEGADLYVAQQGDLFSLDTIETGNFQPLVEDTTFFSASIPVGDFYLAVATTGTDGVPPLDASRDVFGWAHFNIDEQLNITLLDNAVAYGTGNIIVGENAAIPEPSSAALIGLLVAGGFLGRRRR